MQCTFLELSNPPHSRVTPHSSLSLTLQVQAASTDLQSDPDATLSPEDIIYMVTTPPRFGYLEIEPSPFDDERGSGGGGGIRTALDKKLQPEIAPTSVLDGYPSSPFEVRYIQLECSVP